MSDDLAIAKRERDKLQAFKDWVHAYLDAQDVPHHPPGAHGEHGCRIGDRMDWLMEKLQTAEQRCIELSIKRVQTHGTAHCLYCGFTGERKLFAEAKAETLEHGRTCDKHPWRAAERERDDLLAALEKLLTRADRAAALNEWEWTDHACQDCEKATMPEPMFRCARHAARAAIAKAKG